MVEVVQGAAQAGVPGCNGSSTAVVGLYASQGYDAVVSPLLSVCDEKLQLSNLSISSYIQPWCLLERAG